MFHKIYLQKNTHTHTHTHTTINCEWTELEGYEREFVRNIGGMTRNTETKQKTTTTYWCPCLIRSGETEFKG